jgi:hypothetical protein
MPPGSRSSRLILLRIGQGAAGTSVGLFKQNKRLIAAGWSYASLIAVGLGWLFSSAQVDAATLRCASHHLQPDERAEVLDRARRKMPAGAKSLRLESACWNRDFAIAWLRTPTLVDQEGVHWWWAVECRRDKRSWACDQVTRERRIEAVISGAARPMTVSASLPDGMAADRARALITTTATLAIQDEMPLPACSSGRDDATMWRRLRFDPPSPDVEYPSASISMESTGLVVDYGELRISLNAEDRPTCWDLLLLVD